MRAACTALAVVTLAFAQVQKIASQLGSSLSASKAQFVTALDQLAAAYQKAFAPLNCD